MVHACRAAMQALKKTGTDFSSARGMDPKQFFEVMGSYLASDTRAQCLFHDRTERYYQFRCSLREFSIPTRLEFQLLP